MAYSNAQADKIYWHYTPNIKYSLGIDYQEDKITEQSFASARFTYLLHRKNTATSQRNLYLKSGVGLNDSDNHFYGLAGDWRPDDCLSASQLNSSPARATICLNKHLSLVLRPIWGITVTYIPG